MTRAVEMKNYPELDRLLRGLLRDEYLWGILGGLSLCAVIFALIAIFT